MREFWQQIRAAVVMWWTRWWADAVRALTAPDPWEVAYRGYLADVVAGRVDPRSDELRAADEQTRLLQELRDRVAQIQQHQQQELSDLAARWQAQVLDNINLRLQADRRDATIKRLQEQVFNLEAVQRLRGAAQLPEDRL